VTEKQIARRGLIHRDRAFFSTKPSVKGISPMKVHHPSKSRQLPDLFDWAAHRDICVYDHRVRWVARRCRVSRATAETIIANAGFSDGERR
jgi:hypothetical protein